MLKPYDSFYLYKAEVSLAMMLDFAVHDLHRDAAVFFDLFISCGIAAKFENGDVRTIAGMSGIELAYKVLEECGIGVERIGYRYTQGRSREYWTGWALARYQWEKDVSFETIIGCFPLKEIIGTVEKYRNEEIRAVSESADWMESVKTPDHLNEKNYMELASQIDERIRDTLPETRLRQFRLKAGLSQSRLAKASGVPLRTIQQYEQRQKDINKAQFLSIIKLAAVLNCEPGQLIEPDLSGNMQIDRA